MGRDETTITTPTAEEIPWEDYIPPPAHKEKSESSARPLNNKRGKTNLICGENYIYYTLNKQGGY